MACTGDLKCVPDRYMLVSATERNSVVMQIATMLEDMEHEEAHDGVTH